MSTRKKAVAMKYQPGVDGKRTEAPVVLAKGAGLIAEKILRLAEESGVYIHEDADMVEILAGLEVGSEIPEELYEAVAKVLALVYKLNRKKMPSTHKAENGD
jgi:flagellar biosynthesis protein